MLSSRLNYVNIAGMSALPMSLTTVRTMDRSTGAGILAVVGLAIVYVLALRVDAAWPVFWVTGVAFGAICQRSRFCSSPDSATCSSCARAG